MPGATSDEWNTYPEDQFSMVDGEIRVWSSALQFPSGGLTLVANVEDLVDLKAERERLSKAIAVAEKDRDSLAARLANPAFTERAKPEAVEKARADHDARAAEAERLSAALARLG